MSNEFGAYRRQFPATFPSQNPFWAAETFIVFKRQAPTFVNWNFHGIIRTASPRCRPCSTWRVRFSDFLQRIKFLLPNSQELNELFRSESSFIMLYGFQGIPLRTKVAVEKFSYHETPVWKFKHAKQLGGEEVKFGRPLLYWRTHHAHLMTQELLVTT